MTAKKCRKFTVLDAIFLIAALAVGLAWTRYFQNGEDGGESYPHSEEDWWLGPRSPFVHGMAVAEWWVVGLSRCVAVVTIALLLLRAWGRPRGRLRYLTRRPGAVAGGAVLLTVSIDMIRSVVEVVYGVATSDGYDSLMSFTYLRLSGNNAGVAVAATWVLLAISGRWRREPGWLDGVGIALGVFWLMQALLSWIVRFPL